MQDSGHTPEWNGPTVERVMRNGKRIYVSAFKAWLVEQALRPEVSVAGLALLDSFDRLHAVLCAAGYNIKWLLRMIARKGVTFLRRLYLRLCSLAGVQPNWWQTLRAWLAGTPPWPASCEVWV